MAQDDELTFRSDIRDDLDELSDDLGLKDQGGDGKRLYVSEELLVEAYDFEIDLDTGRVIAMLRVGTPHLQTTVRAQSIEKTGSVGISVEGVHDGEELRVYGGFVP